MMVEGGGAQRTLQGNETTLYDLIHVIIHLSKPRVSGVGLGDDGESVHWL